MDLMKKNLSDLSIGEKVAVVAIKAKGAFNRRLRDLGIIPGVVLSIENKAPFGDPISIRCQGMCLALRLEEAKTIWVEQI
jgi:ferrous iron transport protein A